jgi:hypothetical protein
MTLAWRHADGGPRGARAAARGARCIPRSIRGPAWRLPFPAASGAARYAGARLSREATLEEIRGAAAAYRAMGVGGFYLFNFYNAFGSSRPHDDLVYRVLRDLARTENLAGQAKVFAVTKSYYQDGPGSYAYGKQLPAKPGADGALTLTLPVHEDPAAAPFPLQVCELRVGGRGLPAGARVTVIWNGRELEAGARFSTKEITKAAPRQPDAAEDYFHVPIPDPALVRAGDNAAVIRVTGAAAGTVITDLELRYAYQNDYTKLWLREPVRLN